MVIAGEEIFMPKSEEVAAWLDLAEYARELSDIVPSAPSKRAILGIAGLCETLAIHSNTDASRDQHQTALNHGPALGTLSNGLNDAPR